MCFFQLRHRTLNLDLQLMSHVVFSWCNVLLPSAADSPSPPAPPLREPQLHRSWTVLLSGPELNLAFLDYGEPTKTQPE